MNLLFKRNDKAALVDVRKHENHAAEVLLLVCEHCQLEKKGQECEF